MDQETWSKFEIVLVTAAMLMVALSFMFPEFKTITHRTTTNGQIQTTERSFYFDVIKNEFTSIGGAYTTHETYDTVSPTDYTGLGKALGNEMQWLAASIFMFWILVATIAFGQDPTRIVVGWLTVITGIGAVVYPIVALPDSLSDVPNFIGSSSDSGVSMSWGPSLAWYLALVAEVLVGFAVVRRMSHYFMQPKEEREEDELNLPSELEPE